ncbi:DUF1330 domain-containing protein [Solirubrobacter sp. CPCC 204708]|uniref:DUF1330 domain-containing protein n=1 Tax=Solirubrobacter deserti TaxID=2282478 RepID=A0ABT4RS34_9ACTN|nr:DUF1330 domain-containing protein [Solirubrobacter deserti]MBE2319875.1 DUF1330 domain-containing protein [Solirubrobacter deserti]MDA0141408.1 DUF1330 domain-containing protein [Solirubrobacter deserti]
MDLDRFLDEDPGGPVVMLNLLRFRPGGAARYDDYRQALLASGVAADAEPLFFGTGFPSLEGEDWDAVLLVRYPSRAAFAGMIRSPEYRAIEPLRREALEDAVVQPTHWLM